MHTQPEDLECLRKLLREGTCCSVALVQLGLELRGERNDQLLQAMSALCGGIQGGLALRSAHGRGLHDERPGARAGQRADGA